MKWKRERVLKEDEIYTTKDKSSLNLTEMIKWKGINYNDVLYSPVFGEVTLVEIVSSEPTISVRDSRGNLHRFDSIGRLNGNGEIMLFPNKIKNWGYVQEKIFHKIPSKEMLLKENSVAVTEICNIIYRLKLAANFIDEVYDVCFDDYSGSIRYVYSTKINDEDLKIQPLSFNSSETTICINAVDKNNYNPKFETFCYLLPAERDLFEFKSVSAASYFLKLYKDDLVYLYSGLNRYSDIRLRRAIENKVGSFIISESSNKRFELTFENEKIISVPNGASPRQRDLSEKELAQTYFSKDLTKMINWMNIKKGQSLYSPAFGNLELLSIEKEEPRIKTIDSKKRVCEFTSEGKYYEGGEVILFPEKGKSWLPIKKTLKLPIKKDIEKKTDKDLLFSCKLLYGLMVSAHHLNVFFEQILDQENHLPPPYICTCIVTKEGYKYVASCEWIKINIMIRKNYRSLLSCFYLFTFNSYSALYYFIKLFKSEIELIYSQLFNVKISEWRINERLCIPKIY